MNTQCSLPKMQQRGWHSSSPTRHSWLLFPEDNTYISCFELYTLALLWYHLFTDLLFLQHSFPHNPTSGFLNMFFHLPGMLSPRGSRRLTYLLSLTYTPIFTSQRSPPVSSPSFPPLLPPSFLFSGSWSSLIFLWHISMLSQPYLCVYSRVPWLNCH